MRSLSSDRRGISILAVCAAGTALALAGCGGSSDPPVTVQAPLSATCESLAGQSIGGAAISKASTVPAKGSVAEYCDVYGSIGNINFNTRLPTKWNNKILYSGGGGWDGVIPNTALIFSPSVGTSGYVIIESDGGRQGSPFDASSFLNNPQQQMDFGYRQIHTVLQAAKEIVKKRYNSPVERAYFEGCSNGGREALISATRFPTDFDAIVSRAPAYSFTELIQAFISNAKAFNAPGGNISTAKLKLIADTVVAQCDAADGVKDGIVSNVEACTFDPAVLRCSGGTDTGDTCLSDAQINSAKTVYGPTLRADSSLVYPGWGPGGEDLGWPAWLTSTPSVQYLFGSGLVKYWVTQDPSFDMFTFNPENYQPELKLTASILDATPDLREFFAQGRKLILVHGTHDAAISYKGSVKYFNDVATKVGGAAVRDAGMEFFLQPGVQHCLTGVGPDTVELVDAVAKWADGGKRPSEQGIVSKKLDATGGTLLSRPLCRYPTFPKYKGSGDVNSADSYTCQSS